MREAKVRVEGKAMVVPAEATKRQKMFLPSLDIMWKDLHYNLRVLFYESNNLSGQEDGAAVASRQKQQMMEKLKTSLALCLVHYYPWCGRISHAGEGPDPTRLVLLCNDAGVEFVEASIDMPLSHLSHHSFQILPFFENLCQHIEFRGSFLFSSPLLSIQATYFLDGGLALGISQSHIVADGHAFWNFMLSWGECARGVSPLSLPPSLNRERLAIPHPSQDKQVVVFDMEAKEEDYFLVENGEVQVDSISKEEEKGLDDSGVKGKEDGESGSSVGMDPKVQCVLNLPGWAIKKLKVEAGGTYTSYEVMCAHLWQHVTGARKGHQNENALFAVLANGRSRLSPPLPPSYFGNVIIFAPAVSTVGRIRTEKLGATAKRIHEAVDSCREEKLIGMMHWLELRGNSFKPDTIPSGQMMNVASSPRFPVYQVNFGWGQPAAVRSPKVPGDGEMVLFGGRPGSEPGDVEICIALASSAMKRLLDDPHFLAKPISDPPFF